MNDEFAFIANISPKETKQSSLVKGIGDDAAVYQGSNDMDEVVCVDTMVEGIHFLRNTVSPYQLGKKALAVNISDLAAMGAIPSYYLVSIAIPSTWEEHELKDIFAGMATLATEYEIDLIGGDTVSTAGALVLTVTAIGRVERGRALYRNGAQPGDVLFLTGYVGSSAAGLNLLLDERDLCHFTEAEKELLLAHQEPRPHVSQGRLLANSGLRIALNDVSDGIASEAHEIAETSRVNITIDEDAIPFHPSMGQYPRDEQLEYGLFGGEDYVLMGTIARGDLPSLHATFREHCHPFYIIGSVEEGEGNVYLKKANRIKKLEKRGYNHFRKGGEVDERVDGHHGRS